MKTSIKKEDKCINCGNVFITYPKTKRKFCSHKCYTDYYSSGKGKRDLSYITDEYRAEVRARTLKQYANTTEEQKQWAVKKRKETAGWKGWSYKYLCCTECGFTKFKHAASGICTSCYQKRRKQVFKDKELERYVKDGLFYGELGKITYDGDNHRLQCHICGRFYEQLGLHVSEWHLVTLNWYKSQFGIKETFGLATEQLKYDAGQTALKTIEKHGVNERFTAVSRSMNHTIGQKGWRLQSRLEKSAVLKLHHWTKDNPRVEKEWKAKIDTGRNKKVHSHCASCYKPITTSAGSKANSYCDECRRLAYNASQRRYRLRLKEDIVGIGSIQLTQQNTQRLERVDKRCRICGELMCSIHLTKKI